MSESEADTHEGVTVAQEGVEVEKSFELDAFPVPAVKLVVRSEREDAATVRFVDPLPPSVSVDDVGLHPNYGEEALSIQDDAVAFEWDVEADDEYTAVYGLREIDDADLSARPAEPEIESVTPTVSESSSQVVREVIEGITSGDEDDDEDDDEDIETLELRDPNEGVDAAPSPAAEPQRPTDDGSDRDPIVGPQEAPDADRDDGPGAGVNVDQTDAGVNVDQTDAGVDVDQTDAGAANQADDAGAVDDAAAATSDAALPADADGIASALAEELREGRVDDEVVGVLREELDLGSGSTEARIQHLQSELADLHAYTDALEEFLDENGTAQQALADVHDDLDRLDERIGSNRDRLREQADDVEAVEATVAAIEESVSDLRETAESYEETFDEVRESVASVEETTTDIARDLEAYRDDLDDLEEQYGEDVEELSTRVKGVEHLESRRDEEVDAMRDRIEEATDGIEDVREEVERLADDVEDVEAVERRLDDLEETVASMSGDLEEVADVQRRLQSVFAGPSDDDESESA
ncbi:MAG: hypothetical protein ABEJ23_02580 [Haloarculaceae archaeon]